MRLADYTWGKRADRRYGFLIQFAFACSLRPLPMHRYAALWVGCRLYELDRVLWRMGL